ncbi:hypothetical protein SKAU_G00170060 [Synaphobranchus kaupii]|uniref:Uncharacterized protein n=1 Tax=Synaphobranchus kaupii TaxID=118154 RepID=A0A9Q1IZP9_SYNKA|nr:hypothetical protein SKAU_G00170060 [Synaphobranchus kaupii]
MYLWSSRVICDDLLQVLSMHGTSDSALEGVQKDLPSSSSSSGWSRYCVLPEMTPPTSLSKRGLGGTPNLKRLLGEIKKAQDLLLSRHYYLLDSSANYTHTHPNTDRQWW